MKLLALDASTQALSAAVHDSRAPDEARECFEIAPQVHAARLLPAAQQLLDEAGWSLSQLDGLAFGRGPGAFTGLRIAAGLVQGLAYGADLPVAPVSTMQALAQRSLQHHAGEAVRVVQDARMGEVYTADFRRAWQQPDLMSGERVVQPNDLTTPDESINWLYAGNGWPVVADATGQAAPHVCEQWPHARELACLGAYLIEQGGGKPAHEALPVYVRDEVARKPD